MKVSECIGKLQALMDRYGDHAVVASPVGEPEHQFWILDYRTLESGSNGFLGGESP